jgi:hypothetical protein
MPSSRRDLQKVPEEGEEGIGLGENLDKKFETATAQAASIYASLKFG